MVYCTKDVVFFNHPNEKISMTISFSAILKSGNTKVLPMKRLDSKIRYRDRVKVSFLLINISTGCLALNKISCAVIKFLIPRLLKSPQENKINVFIECILVLFFIQRKTHTFKHISYSGQMSEVKN